MGGGRHVYLPSVVLEIPFSNSCKWVAVRDPPLPKWSYSTQQSKRCASRLKPLICDEIPLEKKTFMKNHRSCRTHWCCESQAPKRNHPKRCANKTFRNLYPKRPKEDHPKNFLPNKIIPKDVDPKPFLSKHMTAPKNYRHPLHPIAPVQPLTQSRLKAVDFLLESPMLDVDPSFPCKGTSSRWVAPQEIMLMICSNTQQDGPRADRHKWSYIYNPYKWPEING